MVKVIIGSLVICHLLAPQGQQVQEGQTVTKVLGEIIDITKGSRYIEKVDKKEALEVDTDILIIKGKNKEGVFQVDARACMAVRKETEDERQERVAPKPKKVIEKSDELSLDNQEKEMSQEELDKLTNDAFKAREETKEEVKKEKAPAVDTKNLEEQSLPAVDTPVVEPIVKKEEVKAEPIKEEIKKEEKAAPAVENKKEDTKVKEENKGLLDYLVN